MFLVLYEGPARYLSYYRLLLFLFSKTGLLGTPRELLIRFFWPGRCLRLRFPKSESTMARTAIGAGGQIHMPQKASSLISTGFGAAARAARRRGPRRSTGLLIEGASAHRHHYPQLLQRRRPGGGVFWRGAQQKASIASACAFCGCSGLTERFSAAAAAQGRRRSLRTARRSHDWGSRPRAERRHERTPAWRPAGRLLRL